MQSGKDLTKADEFDFDQVLRVELRGSLKGGKGGFGSLLRSVKPKAQQDDNFEACRDLSGRRLRHINNERRIQEFHQRQEEEQKYVQEELKEYEAKKKQLKGAIQANNNKLDEAYVRELAQSGSAMVQSVQLGAAHHLKSSDSLPRMGCAEKRASKKKKSILSLHELLCNDVKSLEVKPKGEAGEKSKSRTESQEFEAFMKKQLEANKRRKVATTELLSSFAKPESPKQQIASSVSEKRER